MKAAPLLEYSALEYIDALRNGRPLPASTDLIAHFPTWPGLPRRAARILAAYANTARGQEVLWLIGVRDNAVGKLTLPGADSARFDEWLHGLAPYFDGLVPVVRAFTLDTGAAGVQPGRQPIALQIDSARAPFVVRAQPASANLEVPWWDRQARQVRSAGRHELVRGLVPMQGVPQFKEVEAEFTFYKHFHGTGATKPVHRWTLDGSLYVIPQPGSHLVIPLHRCHAGIAVPDSGFRAAANDLTLTADRQSPAVRVTESAALVDGPGRMFVYCSGTMATADAPLTHPLTLTFDLLPAGAERAAVVSVPLRPTPVTESNQAGRWKL